MTANPAARFERNSDLIDQSILARNPAAVIGCGAIGSRIAPELARMGVTNLYLYDPDSVSVENLSVQGFNERELRFNKATAVTTRCCNISPAIQVSHRTQQFTQDHLAQLPKSTTLFLCVDSIKTREEIFEWFHTSPAPQIPRMIDTRMAAEAFHLYYVDRTPQSIVAYQSSLFTEQEAAPESCTARGTAYGAMIAAGFAVALFKTALHRQDPPPHAACDIPTFDMWSDR